MKNQEDNLNGLIIRLQSCPKITPRQLVNFVTQFDKDFECFLEIEILGIYFCSSTEFRIEFIHASDNWKGTFKSKPGYIWYKMLDGEWVKQKEYDLQEQVRLECQRLRSDYQRILYA